MIPPCIQYIYTWKKEIWEETCKNANWFYFGGAIMDGFYFLLFA